MARGSHGRILQCSLHSTYPCGEAQVTPWRRDGAITHNMKPSWQRGRIYVAFRVYYFFGLLDSPAECGCGSSWLSTALYRTNRRALRISRKARPPQLAVGQFARPYARRGNMSTSATAIPARPETFWIVSDFRCSNVHNEVGLFARRGLRGANGPPPSGQPAKAADRQDAQECPDAYAFRPNLVRRPSYTASEPVWLAAA
jgi:hypothetical protein